MFDPHIVYPPSDGADKISLVRGSEKSQTVPAGLLFAAIGEANMPQAEFARRIDESPQTLTNWKSRGIPWDKISIVAAALGLTVDQYLANASGKRPLTAARGATQATPPLVGGNGSGRVKVSQIVTQFTNGALTPATYSIPLLDVEAAMGLEGRVQPEYETILDDLQLNQQFVRSHLAGATSPRNIRIITGHGDSMKGTYEDGSPLFVDIGVTEIKTDATYVFVLNRELFIKRLQRRPDGSVMVISDNDKYPPYQVTEREEMRVIGRVIAAWNLQHL